MVGAIADAAPGIQRRPLIVEEVERLPPSRLSCQLRTCGQAEQVSDEQTCGLVSCEAGVHVVHCLRCRVVGRAHIISGRTPQIARIAWRSEAEISCGGWEQILPEPDRRSED